MCSPPSLVARDMRPDCCQAWGVPVRDDRPCLYLSALLSDDECQAILAGVAQRHEPEPASLDAGCRSQFTLDDAELSARLYERLREHVPQQLDGGRCVGLRRSWTHARYAVGQSVFAHMDQRQTCDERRLDDRIASRLTLNAYLDDGYAGSDFLFVTGVRLDGSFERAHTTLRPRAGDAVLFYQGVPEFSHAVTPLTSGVKTIMRSDVLYAFPDAAAAAMNN